MIGQTVLMAAAGATILSLGLDLFRLIKARKRGPHHGACEADIPCSPACNSEDAKDVTRLDRCSRKRH
jgi:hypothetical protein